MTIREMLSLARSGLGQVGRLRYKTGTTTGAGAATGTTFVSSSFGGVDDAWNEAEIRITSGDNSGQRREIGDWVNSGGTGTVVESFTHLVATSVTFEVGEKGFISDHELLELFTEAQDEIIIQVVPDAFPGHTTVLEVAGTAGLSAALPANLAGPPKSLGFRDASSNEYDVVLLPPGERDRFAEDAFLGSTLNDMVAIFENGKIRYRPVNNGTLLLPVVPKFDSVTFSGGSKLPSYMHHLQTKYAIWKGYRKKQQTGLATEAKTDFYDSVNAINSQHGNITKQMQERN